MIVTVHIQFPDHLTEEQRMLVRAALQFPAQPKAGHTAAAAAFLDSFMHATSGWSTGHPASVVHPQ